MMDEPAVPIHVPILRTAYYRQQNLEAARLSFGGGDERMARTLVALESRANQFLDSRPYSVVDKTTLPPSGDIHDYWHPAPYAWPNPGTPDGLPYVRRDGQRVPGTRLYEPESAQYDRTSLQRMFDESTVLALAWHLTGKKAYAEKSAELIRTWFLNESTRMNPHLEYAQVFMGRNGNRGTNYGLIETKDFYFFLDAVRLIGTSLTWTASDESKMRLWCRSFLDWLLTSEQGRTEKRGPNNHGVCYDLQIAALAAYLGDTALLDTIARSAQARLGGHFAKDGRQPHELARTTTFHYCAFNLQTWLNLATVLENAAGVDLWNSAATQDHFLGRALGHLLPSWLTGKPDRPIERALRWFLPYYREPWEYPQIDEFNRERLVPLYYGSRRKYPALTEELGPLFPNLAFAEPCYFPHDGIPLFWMINAW